MTARARHHRRWSISDKKIEHIIVKAVCGFLNAEGGTLLIRRRRWWRDSRTWQRPPDSRRVGGRRVPGHRSSRAKLGPTLGPGGDPGDELAVRKLRRVNECVDGYEPGGRRFESCRAHQILRKFTHFKPSHSLRLSPTDKCLTMRRGSRRFSVASSGLRRTDFFRFSVT